MSSTQIKSVTVQAFAGSYAPLIKGFAVIEVATSGSLLLAKHKDDTIHLYFLNNISNS